MNRQKQLSVFGPAALPAVTGIGANGLSTAMSSTVHGYVPPTLSSFTASPLALKPKVVRWRPITSRALNSDSSTTRHAVIGSYGEGENTLTVRAVDTSDHTERERTERKRNGAHAPAPAPVERVGAVMCRAVHDGDVNDLRFVVPNNASAQSGSGASSSTDVLATASSNGSVYLYALGTGAAATKATAAAAGPTAMDDDGSGAAEAKSVGGFIKPKPKLPSAAVAAAAAAVGSGQLSLSLVHSWKALHAGAAATCIDYQPASHALVSGGEDGALHVLSPDTQQHVLAIPNAHSGSIYAVRWNGPNTLLSCGMSGRLFGWDTRQSVSAGPTGASGLPTAGTAAAAAAAAAANGAAAAVSKASTKRSPAYVCDYKAASALTCLAVHPSRPDTVATGSAEGVLNLWDVRASATPTASLQLHSSVVWDVLFLPALPTAVVTCGEDGAVVLTDFNALRAQPSAVSFTTASAASAASGSTTGIGTGSASIQQMVLYRGDLSCTRLDVDARAPHPHTLLCTSDTSALLCAQHFFLRDA